LFIVAERTVHRYSDLPEPDSEDARQDIALHLWRQHRVHPLTPAQAYEIARNYFLNWRREMCRSRRRLRGLKVAAMELACTYGVG